MMCIEAEKNLFLLKTIAGSLGFFCLPEVFLLRLYGSHCMASSSKGADEFHVYVVHRAFMDG